MISRVCKIKVSDLLFKRLVLLFVMQKENHRIDKVKLWKGVEIARIVKQHLDEKWEPYWHVFLGKSFGCHAVHEKRSFKYFTFEESNILFLLSILNTEIFNSIGESWLGVLGFIIIEFLYTLFLICSSYTNL